MARADLCPDCREKIHPFAATCPSCGMDLDAHRRQRRTAGAARRTPALPSLSSDLRATLLCGLLLLVLALFAPLFGAVFSILVTWHSDTNGYIARRNVAIFCAALALFNLVAPTVLLPHLIF